MNLNQAINILGISNNDLTVKKIKNAYMREALKCHPDKHQNISNERFIQINEAYTYLNEFLSLSDETTIKNDIKKETTYIELISQYINSITGLQINSDILLKFINGIQSEYNNFTINYFREINRKDAILLYTYLQKFSLLIGISNETLKNMEKIINEKMGNDKYIILRPKFENLFEPLFYQYNYDGEKYYIPLWHEEVEFEIDNNSLLIVQLMPTIPENIFIDENSDLHVSVNVILSDLIKKDKINIIIGPKTIKIDIKTLNIVHMQTIKYKEQGIIKINTYEIKDGSKIGDVYITLLIDLDK